MHLEMKLALDQSRVLAASQASLEKRISETADSIAEGAPEVWKAEVDRLRRENEALRARVKELEARQNPPTPRR